MPETDAWIVREGQDVLGNDGKRIGEVVGSTGNTLIVKHGRFFSSRELFVPASAIAAIDREAVHLNVSAETASGSGSAWRTPPPASERVAPVSDAPSAAAFGAAAGAVADADSWTISEGMRVVGADGETIGEVADGNAEAISVRIGRLFSHVVPVAADQIMDVRDQAVYVNTTRAALEHGKPATAAAPEAAAAGAAPAATTSSTPLGDLQGRIANAWRTGTGDRAAGATAAEEATAPESPTVDAGTSATTPAPGVSAEALSSLPPADVAGKAEPDRDVSPEAATAAAAAPGLIDSLRTRIGDLLDRPAPSTAPSESPAGETTADTEPGEVAAESPAATVTPQSPPAPGVFDTMRARVAAFMDKPADAPEASPAASDVDAETDGATTESPAAAVPETLLEETTASASPPEGAEPAPAADETSEAIEETSETLAAGTDAATTSSRFTVVTQHGDGDDLLADASDDTESSSESKVPAATSEPAPAVEETDVASAEADIESVAEADEDTAGSESDTETGEAVSVDADATASGSETETEPETDNDEVVAETEPAADAANVLADDRVAADDEAITTDALAAESLTGGEIDEQVEDAAIVAASSEDETDLTTDEVSAFTASEGAADEADLTSDEPVATAASLNEPGPESDATSDEAIASTASADAAIDEETESATVAPSSDASDASGTGATDEDMTRSSADSEASASADMPAPAGEPHAGDDTIAANAVTGTLAHADDAVASATNQNATIAGNALHGKLQDGDSLARSWAAGAAAATRSGAQSLAAGETPHIDGSTTLAAHATEGETLLGASGDAHDVARSDAPGETTAPDATQDAEAHADSDAHEHPEKDASHSKHESHDVALGPSATEGIDWVAAVEGEDEPNGWTVKGNANSGIYHTTESRFYERTIPEIWFPSAEAAERAGYRAPRGAHHAGQAADADANAHDAS